MLEFRIKAGEIDLTPETEAYIRERAEHLDAFYDLILTCRRSTGRSAWPTISMRSNKTSSRT